MAKPRSIQQPPTYLTRHIFRFVDSTGFTAAQWRLIAREPVNRMAQRFVVRELSALQWTITSDRRDDSRVDEYTARWDEIFEDADGFTIWLSRMIEDACSLPFGGASEVGYKGEDLAWALHVDAATLFPTYERRVPYVQVNPDKVTQRIYFRRDQLRRLRVNPRPDIRYKEYQVSPTEDAFLPIEALSKIYLYYMQELTDTIPLGILDVMDWNEDDAMDWAANFREMIEGTDHIKIPILYDHVGEAKFIPFGRSPQDLNVVEQFKRFAEMLLAKYGLSIGDLRLFEHESTKAGERVSQIVTERSGIGFWVALIEAFVNRLLPSGLKFQFKQPRPERELVVANRKSVQMNMLLAATGMQPLIDVKDAVEEAQALELFVTEVKPVEAAPPPPPLNGGPPQGPPELPGGEPEEQRDQMSDQDLSKALLGVGPMVEKALGPAWQHPEPPARERLAETFKRAFEGSGEAVDEEHVGAILEIAKRALEPSDEAGVEKGGPGSGNWGHAGRSGKRGGSASRRVQAGITSHKPGKDITQVRAEMRQFGAKLKAVPGVRNVSVEEGTGAWAGGNEPTWVTRYEVVTEEGGRQALSLLAETGKRFNQDGVLVMQFVSPNHPNAQPVDQIDFGAKLDQRRLRAIEGYLAANKVGGWTWSKNERGSHVLQVASVPQWGGSAETHTRTINSVVAKLVEKGMHTKRSTSYIDPLTMDASNYDDYIIQR